MKGNQGHNSEIENELTATCPTRIHPLVHVTPIARCIRIHPLQPILCILDDCGGDGVLGRNAVVHREDESVAGSAVLPVYEALGVIAAGDEAAAVKRINNWHFLLLPSPFPPFCLLLFFSSRFGGVNPHLLLPPIAHLNLHILHLHVLEELRRHCRQRVVLARLHAGHAVCDGFAVEGCIWVRCGREFGQDGFL